MLAFGQEWDWPNGGMSGRFQTTCNIGIVRGLLGGTGGMWDTVEKAKLADRLISTFGSSAGSDAGGPADVSQVAHRSSWTNGRMTRSTFPYSMA